MYKAEYMTTFAHNRLTNTFIIAILLGISHQTVKNHVTAILRKFGVEDRTQAVKGIPLALIPVVRELLAKYDSDSKVAV